MLQGHPFLHLVTTAQWADLIHFDPFGLYRLYRLWASSTHFSVKQLVKMEQTV